MPFIWSNYSEGFGPGLPGATLAPIVTGADWAMASGLCISDDLRDHEGLGALGCQLPTGRRNLLVATITRHFTDDDIYLKANQLSPVGLGFSYFGMDAMTVPGVDDPPLRWIELMKVHDPFGATGWGPSNRSNLLVSAANVRCYREFWDVHPSNWDTSVDISVADPWCFLEVEDGTLPILADVRFDMQTFVAPLPSFQHHQCRVLDFFSGGYGGAMANPAQTEAAVNAGFSFLDLDLNGICILGDSTAWLLLLWLGTRHEQHLHHDGECRAHEHCDTDLGTIWASSATLVSCLWMMTRRCGVSLTSQPWPLCVDYVLFASHSSCLNLRANGKGLFL